MSKQDAIIAAHKVAIRNGLAGYAVETINGWVVAERKPSLRFGEVLECRNGKEFRV